MKHVAYSGRLVMVGFGSIGQGVLPLILRHIGISPERIGEEVARKLIDYSDTGATMGARPIPDALRARSSRSEDMRPKTIMTAASRPAGSAPWSAGDG